MMKKIATVTAIAVVCLSAMDARADEKHAVRVVRDVAYLPGGTAENKHTLDLYPEYGGNADQVFVIGHSAGAYLVALLSTDERYLAKERLSLGDIRGAVPAGVS